MCNLDLGFGDCFGIRWARPGRSRWLDFSLYNWDRGPSSTETGYRLQPRERGFRKASTSNSVLLHPTLIFSSVPWHLSVMLTWSVTAHCNNLWGSSLIPIHVLWYDQGIDTMANSFETWTSRSHSGTQQQQNVEIHCCIGYNIANEDWVTAPAYKLPKPCEDDVSKIYIYNIGKPLNPSTYFICSR